MARHSGGTDIATATFVPAPPPETPALPEGEVVLTLSVEEAVKIHRFLGPLGTIWGSFDSYETLYSPISGALDSAGIDPHAYAHDVADEVREYLRY